MKKLLWLLLVVALAISMVATFSLAGCKEEAAEEEVVLGPEVELIMLNYLDITSPEAAAWDATVEAFTAKYPNITLTIENSFGDAYHQKLAALAAAGDLPDVMS